jgi:hypothetical protein
VHTLTGDPPPLGDPPPAYTVRHLEMDPAFLLQVCDMHKVTHIATQEVLTYWTTAALDKHKNEGQAAASYYSQPCTIDQKLVQDFQEGASFTTIWDLIFEQESDKYAGTEQEVHPVILLRTPSWAKSKLHQFTKLVQRLFIENCVRFTLICLSLVPDVPGTWELWHLLSPCEYMTTALSDHVHDRQCVDFKVLHKLYGATHNRGWDYRPSRGWITVIKPHN